MLYDILSDNMTGRVSWAEGVSSCGLTGAKGIVVKLRVEL
jgi:hypothetical protein